ncbi:HIT domain-containing protein [Candidatus Babeliales bacterium]|nr:HIT domain-containing protein [Candidatus Babeliales bacterium]MBP9843430.1 HIT domain-containing protein [Candidatus Babeliales bacterium]
MDILYAPWRDTYITKSKKNEKPSDQDCVFCKKLVDKNSSDQDDSAEEFILKKTKHAFIILNLYPYNGGHLLILPRQHVAQLEDVSAQVRAELMELMSASIVILKNVLKAEGINTGLNLGRASGAGIPSHLHFHVVPRWFGDTSFITTIGDTKNVSVDLHRIYQDLKPAFQALEI